VREAELAYTCGSKKRAMVHLKAYLYKGYRVNMALTFTTVVRLPVSVAEAHVIARALSVPVASIGALSVNKIQISNGNERRKDNAL
jgi:hypothetical protein